MLYDTFDSISKKNSHYSNFFKHLKDFGCKNQKKLIFSKLRAKFVQRIDSSKKYMCSLTAPTITDNVCEKNLKI